MVKNRRSPLRHRYLRQLRKEPGRYLAIFVFMTIAIGFVSGFLVADGSMIAAYEESFDRYQIEDGHFCTLRALSPGDRSAIEELGIQVYDLPYIDLREEGSTIRVYPWWREVDQICLMKGEIPEGSNEVAVDRLWAQNHHLTTGDTLTLKEKTFTIAGLVAFSDYSCLFEDNADAMFDAVLFCVAAVDAAAFEKLSRGVVLHNYAWLEKGKRPQGDVAENDRAEYLATRINKISSLQDFVPRHRNKAICFTGDDMGSDKVMFLVFLYILIIILGFVFALNARSQITEEAVIIGTLRATGCRRGELLTHYMFLPTMVSLLAALVGNVLGYTVFKEVSIDLYYDSYSLTTYETVWNGEAFLLTTVIPLIMITLIHVFILARTLTLSPIRFLRGDLRRGHRRNGPRFPSSWPFLTRFRLRVLLQNASAFFTLGLGILFGSALLDFGLMGPLALDVIQKDIVTSLPSAYQTILAIDDKDLGFIDRIALRYMIVTETEGAEAFCLTTLKTLPGSIYQEEDISVYGISPKSRYLPDTVQKGTVFTSEYFAEKYHLEAGDSFTLRDPYTAYEYVFTLSGVCHYPAALSVFLPISDFNETFGHEGWFRNGYFSEEEIEDLDERLIATVIDAEDMTKTSRQLDLSLGGFMDMMAVFSVVLFLLLMYLLTKMIIERGSRSISLLKILGATAGEAASLYLSAAGLATVLGALVCIPLADQIVKLLFQLVISTQMSGWLPVPESPATLGKIGAVCIGSFAIVALLEFRRIRQVPMSEALKDVL